MCANEVTLAKGAEIYYTRVYRFNGVIWKKKKSTRMWCYLIVVVLPHWLDWLNRSTLRMLYIHMQYALCICICIVYHLKNHCRKHVKGCLLFLCFTANGVLYIVLCVFLFTHSDTWAAVTMYVGNSRALIQSYHGNISRTNSHKMRRDKRFVFSSIYSAECTHTHIHPIDDTYTFSPDFIRLLSK